MKMERKKSYYWLCYLTTILLGVNLIGLGVSLVFITGWFKLIMFGSIAVGFAFLLDEFNYQYYKEVFKRE